MANRIDWVLDKLYKKHKTMDPFVISENLGIDVHYVYFKKNPLGQYLKIMEKPTILLNSRLEDSNERYFVASHELHHAIEHEDICSYYTLNNLSRSKMEQEANKFAAAMCLNLYIEEQGKLPETTVDLLNEYGVPLQLSEILL